MGARDTLESRKKHDAAYRHRNQATRNANQTQYRRSFKTEVLNQYGLCCAKCGFDDIRALQIDHVNNNGNVERRRLGSKSFSGWRFYQWLKSQNWPEGYQTLCANCNIIKHIGDSF